MDDSGILGHVTLVVVLCEGHNIKRCQIAAPVFLESARD